MNNHSTSLIEQDKTVNLYEWAMKRELRILRKVQRKFDKMLYEDTVITEVSKK